MNDGAVYLSDRAAPGLRDRVFLVVLIFWNLTVFLLCLPNVAYNNFVIKASVLAPRAAYGIDPLFRFLIYEPLSAPLWLFLLSRFGLRLRARTLAVVGAFVLACVALNFPVFQIDLAGAMDWSGLLRAALLYGITKPMALLFFSAGLYFLLPDFGRVPRFRHVCLVYAMGIGVALLLFGPALPRLEDEIAYHVQALIFESGALRGTVLWPEEIAGVGVRSVLHLPYLIFRDHSFFSAHFHGWSAVLALSSLVGLKPFANALVCMLNLFLFTLLVRRLNERRSFRVIAIVLFISCPVLILLSNTYMAHPLSLSSILALLILWQRLEGAAGHARLFLPAAIALLVPVAFFIRPQTILPTTAALILADTLRLILGAKAKHSRSRIAFRAGALLVGLALALLSGRLYAAQFGSESIFFTAEYFGQGCQALGFGPGHGCFPTYGTLGHSLRKVLLITLDLANTLNQEHAPGGLPLLLVFFVLAIRNWRSLFNPAQPEFVFLVVFGANFVLFSLYFHNGGESYRGRYLTESAFALYILIAQMLATEWQATKASEGGRLEQTLAIVTTTLVFSNVLLLIRGDYINPEFQPFRSASELSSPAPSNALISAVDRPLPRTFIDEFDGKTGALSVAELRPFLNLGYGTLAATAVRLDAQGYLRDARNNALVGDAGPHTLNALGRQMGTETVLRLEFQPAAYRQLRPGISVFDQDPPILRRMESAR